MLPDGNADFFQPFHEEAMNFALKNLIALSLFATLFAQSAFAQQVEFTLVQVKARKMQTPAGPSTELVPQAYTVQIPYTENVTQQYTVQVPYQEEVEQSYKVTVPYTETITGDDGKEVEIKKTRIEEKTRMVPVTKYRAETKTRNVAVTRMRTETRNRKVAINRPGSKMKATKFPPADAKFAYVSGKKIPVEKIEELADSTITILQLQAGEKLTKLQREVLKPNLIVMTLAPKKAS